MVRIVSHEELSYHGISPAEIQKSLEIECFKKKFQRKSDLPKKFREKAIYTCNTIIEMGLESFITETNYSYTVWEESQIQKEEIKPNKITVTLDNNKSTQTENTDKITNTATIFTNKISQYLKESKITNSSDSFTEINDIEILEGNIDDDADDDDYTYIPDFSSPQTYSPLSNQVNLSQQHEKIATIEQNEMSTMTEHTIKYRGVTVTSDNDESANIRKKRQRTYRGITY